MAKIKFLLHSDSLTRGASTNAESICTYLKSLFDIESIIVSPKSSSSNCDVRIQDMVSRGLPVRLYRDYSDLKRIAEIESISHSYFLTSGQYSNLWIPGTKHLVHAVFNWFEPHGDVYAYVSNWLFNKALTDKRGRTKLQIDLEGEQTHSPYRLDFNTRVTWVPHTVVTHKGNGENFRKKYNIPLRYKIVGRIGGFNQFDDSAALKGVLRILEKRKDIKFVFCNTREFIQHSQVTYIKSITEREKWDFYDAGELFLNGRSMGETFGFSIVEPLMVGKPVIAPDRLRHPSMDAAHMEILRPLKFTYFTSFDFARKIMFLLDSGTDRSALINSVNMFTPEISMQRFFSEFILD